MEKTKLSGAQTQYEVIVLKMFTISKHLTWPKMTTFPGLDIAFVWVR